MDPEYWRDRWVEGRTGFHIDEVNPGLIRFAPRLLGDPPARVLIPLCGMSHDIDWLAAQGHQVTGVELAAIPIAEVLARLGGADAVTALPEGGRRHQAGPVTLLEADVLTCALPEVDAIWDRGAIIALTPDQRDAYAQRLRAALVPGGRILVTVICYDQRQMPGPPHCVLEDELRRHYAGFTFEHLHAEDLGGPDSKWAERGLTEIEAHTWLITKPA